MTEHDKRERDEDRPKVRVVDKRRFGGGGSAPAGTAGAAPPAEQPGRSGTADAAPPDELAEARTQAAEYRDHLQRLQAHFESFRKGVELVCAKLADTLRSEGLERIEAEDKPFDPNEHEALMQTGEGDGEPRVAEVFRQGYKLRGSVIRPASVRVERE